MSMLSRKFRRQLRCVDQIRKFHSKKIASELATLEENGSLKGTQNTIGLHKTYIFRGFFYGKQPGF